MGGKDDVSLLSSSLVLVRKAEGFFLCVIFHLKSGLGKSDDRVVGSLLESFCLKVSKTFKIK
jgi:hypothetical protein